MSDIAIEGSAQADELLHALEEQLRALGERHELVVIGGSALLALGLVERATRDVDVVAVRVGGSLADASVLPKSVLVARDRVAADFAVPTDWLNAQPAGLFELGLPDGFDSRLVRREYGPSLVVWYASRFDQIHFKLYALADREPGKHDADLRALRPTSDEIVAAARWAITHDPSEGFRSQLLDALDHLGFGRGTLDA